MIYRRSFLSVWLTTNLVLLAACGGSEDQGADHEDMHDCVADTRDDAYVAGIAKTGDAGYTIRIDDSLPAPPERGDNSWTVHLSDADGAPVTSADFDVSPFMPDHGHGTPVEAEISEMGSGQYSIAPVNLFMPGLWEISLTPRQESGALDSVVFKFCIPG